MLESKFCSIPVISQLFRVYAAAAYVDAAAAYADTATAYADATTAFVEVIICKTEH